MPAQTTNADRHKPVSHSVLSLTNGTSRPRVMLDSNKPQAEADSRAQQQQQLAPTHNGVAQPAVWLSHGPP